MLVVAAAAGFGDLSGNNAGKPPVPVAGDICCSFVFLVAAFRGIALPERAVVMSPPRTGAALGSTGPSRLARPMSVRGGPIAQCWAASPRLAGLRTR